MLTIEVEHLSKSYGSKFLALDDATFRYDGPGAIGYLGPNGAGKTTTLKLLVGLLRPTRGGTRLNGVDVRDDPKRALWDVGAVIETPEPYPSQTVRQALELVGQFRGIDRGQLASEIDELRVSLDLPPLDAKCGKLSKGQRQRAVIAGTMLGDPKVLLLDEPTSGLDPKERVLIRNLLNRLKRDHLILMSSHLMGEVTDICDRVLFVNRGKILLQDSVDKVAERFRSRLLEIEFATPMSPEGLRPLGALVSSVEAVTERKLHLGFDGADPTRVQILRKCLELGPVTSFTNASLVLEDAYLQLMQLPA